jgi:membrane protease YdiL (CAAX protease family)
MDTDPALPRSSEIEMRSDSQTDSHRDQLADSQPPDSYSASRSTPNLAPGSPAQPPTSHPRESALAPIAEIFAGPEGLYPGTRWLIYLAMAYITFGLLNFLLSGLRPEPVPVWWAMVAEARMMLAVILPAFAMARIEGRPFGDFGLPAKRAFGRDFWAGALWGIASLTALMLVLAALGAFSFGSLSLHGARIFKFAFYYAVFFLIVAFFEDFFMRGYSQWVLAEGMHFWPAAALLSVLFGALHLMNPGEARIGIVAVVAIGLFFCLTLRRTGTLWWAVGFHMSWDWGESYFYSVPDSGTISRGHLLNSAFHGPDWLTGGGVGPEGSYLLFVLIVALWILFSRAYPNVKFGMVVGQQADTTLTGLLES